MGVVNLQAHDNLNKGMRMPEGLEVGGETKGETQEQEGGRERERESVCVCMHVQGDNKQGEIRTR